MLRTMRNSIAPYLAGVLLPALAWASTPLVLDVDITSPADGAVVSGLVIVSGTSTDVGNGRVSVSIDGGPFQLATGTDVWSFAWNTSGVGDGPHTITARARQFIGGPAVFDTAQVQVSNAGGGLAVQITSPPDGAQLFSTFVMTGSSSGATDVTVSVDGGPELPTNGLDPWDAVFEQGALSPGPHTLRARATDGQAEVFDQVAITIGDPPPGTQIFTYSSSVDGVQMNSKLFVPTGLDLGGPAVPLVVNLHGGGGLGSIPEPAELDARGWLAIGPDGREWGLADLGCTWPTSAAYVDSPDPNVGPGEQDIFDAIDWAIANLPVDTDRIYLTGFSMGGRGAYAIGLKNPDYFAAIAPRAPAIDMYEIFVRRPEPSACKAGMMGGDPGTSPFVDTMYRITSGRFLVENAYNLPVFHGHGRFDTTANNTLTNAPFLHGYHITHQGNFSACHDAPDFCFGNTPTLAELAQAMPGGYDWAFMFTDVAHSQDPRWFLGTPNGPAVEGMPDPQNPGSLLGAFDFFAARSLVHSPETVVFKTYEDQHRGAFWTELVSAQPWQDVPAAVRARRIVGANTFEVELARVAELQLDVDRAGLALGPETPLVIQLERLVEPAFDPALNSLGEVLSPGLVLEADLGQAVGATVLLDGQPLPGSALTLHVDELRIDPIPITGVHLVEVVVSERGCSGAPNSFGPGAVIAHIGSTSLAANDLVLQVDGAVPGTFGLFFYGPDEAEIPFGDGNLCIGGAIQRLQPALLADAGGSAERVVDLPTFPTGSGPGQITAGSAWSFQYWYRDTAAQGAGFNTSDALRCGFVP